eukprot:3706127-Pyramimonas_sp.AAC.1
MHVLPPQADVVHMHLASCPSASKSVFSTKASPPARLRKASPSKQEWLGGVPNFMRGCEEQGQGKHALAPVVKHALAPLDLEGQGVFQGEQGQQ